MLSVNHGVENSKVLGLNAVTAHQDGKGAAVAPAAAASVMNKAQSASAVVELSGSLNPDTVSHMRHVDHDNAQQLSLDIAGMLSGSFGVQSNISAFDANRLLAD